MARSTRPCDTLLIVVIALVVSPTCALGQTTESKVIETLRVLHRSRVSGDEDKLKALYHAEAIRVSPATVRPSVNKIAIFSEFKTARVKRKPLYFYLRQPQVTVTGETSVVVANYEAGTEESGKPVETNGKVVYIMTRDGDAWIVGAEILAPNLNAGSYGPLGSALSSKKVFGIFPSRAIPPPDSVKPPKLRNDTEKLLYQSMEKINKGFVTGDVDKLMANYDTRGTFSIGDFGPFYHSGVDEVRQHFVDFFKTSKMLSIRHFNPVIRVFGSIGVVVFDYDSELEVSGTKIRSPGRAAYVFDLTGPSPTIRGCTQSALVDVALGDPYP